MTSCERRKEGRYQRRKAAREAKKWARYAQYDQLEHISRYQALYRADRKSMRDVSWKTSVQRYQMNLLRNMDESNKKLNAGEDVTKGFVEFDVVERGKKRHIRSVHYSERVVQKSVCDNALVPMLRRGLIYDNGACLEGKGVDWALDRMEAQLRQFYRANGCSNEGWVGMFDFSGYFDSILHRECFCIYDKAFRDARILRLLRSFVTPFGYPCQSANWSRAKRQDPEDYTGLSLGLGSQISQITAVSYPNRLDHAIKQDIRARWYIRYMDDGRLLFRTKQEAKEAMGRIAAACAGLGIQVNPRKTGIAPLRRGFPFLKVRFRLTESGKVERRLCRDSETRQRRRLKVFAAKVAAGEMDVADAKAAYCSWKGYALRRGGRRAVARLDALFTELFHERAPQVKLKKIGGNQHGRAKHGNHQRRDDREGHQYPVQHRRADRPAAAEGEQAGGV